MNRLSKYVVMLAMTATVGATAIAADMAEKSGESHMGWHHMTPEKMREHMATRQAYLHDQLKLTAAQEPAWKTYIAAVTPTDMGKYMGDRAVMDKLPAPQRMEKHLQMMKDNEARMSTQLAALKTFYATLTPEQQQIFNKQTMHGNWHHGHHGEHGERAAEGKAKG